MSNVDDLNWSGQGEWFTHSLALSLSRFPSLWELVTLGPTRTGHCCEA